MERNTDSPTPSTSIYLFYCTIFSSSLVLRLSLPVVVLHANLLPQPREQAVEALMDFLWWMNAFQSKHIFDLADRSPLLLKTQIALAVTGLALIRLPMNNLRLKSVALNSPEKVLEEPIPVLWFC